MLLQDLRRIFSKFSFGGRSDFGDWAEFAEPEEVLDFVSYLNE